MTYGNRNPNPKHDPLTERLEDNAREFAAQLLASEAGRRAIRDALDEEAVAYRLALYRGARTPHATDEWLANFILNEAVGVKELNADILEFAKRLDK
jgi:hypothetical protein